MIFKFLLLFLMQLVVVSSCLGASKGMGEAFPRIYPEMVPAPFSQNAATAQLKTAGCQTCHAKAEHKTMHKAPSVVLGCTDCHGGNANVQWAGDLWVAPETAVASHASAALDPDKGHAGKSSQVRIIMVTIIMTPMGMTTITRLVTKRQWTRPISYQPTRVFGRVVRILNDPLRNC